MIQCGTIRQVYQQLKENGYHVTMNALRVWVTQKILPAAYVGKKAYITYDNAVSVLKNGTATPDKEPHSTGIRRING